MPFQLREYKKPDFNEQKFKDAPDARCEIVTKDGVAPENFHAMSIFPEYFKIGGKWLLAEESRMDCVPVLKNGKIEVVEFRLLRCGDAVICGRTENCEDGIFLHADGFQHRIHAFSYLLRRKPEVFGSERHVFLHYRRHYLVVGVLEHHPASAAYLV